MWKAEDFVKYLEEKGEEHAKTQSGTFAADISLALEIIALKKRIAHLEHITGALPEPHIPEHRTRKT